MHWSKGHSPPGRKPGKRGCQVQMFKDKHWAMLITCLYIQVIHIEVIEPMDISSFMNTLEDSLPYMHLSSYSGLIIACRTQSLLRGGNKWKHQLWFSMYQLPDCSVLPMGWVWESKTGNCRLCWWEFWLFEPWNFYHSPSKRICYHQCQIFGYRQCFKILRAEPSWHWLPWWCKKQWLAGTPRRLLCQGHVQVVMETTSTPH